MNNWYKVETDDSLNPCFCGCTRRAYFRHNGTVFIKCVMCLTTASGSTEAEAERNWDEMTKKKEVKKVATRRKRTDSGKTASSR